MSDLTPRERSVRRLEEMETTSELIVTLYQDDMLSEKTAHWALDLMEIRGGFDRHRGYTGYDYANQAWVEFAPPKKKVPISKQLLKMLNMEAE